MANASTIDITNISDEAAEKIAAALIEDQEEALALIVLREHGDCVVVADDGNADVEYPGCSHDEAAQEYVDDGDWNCERPTWIHVSTWDRYTLGDVTLDDESSRQRHSVELAQEEPECTHDDEHDWRSPHSVLGGCESNPGVWGNGGGVIIREICRHCGCLRTTDTWATDPQDGTQGHRTVTYEQQPHDYSGDALQRWIAD